MKKKTVFLTSYMRPELTRRSIDRILKWDGLNKLIVIIDGLRNTASLDEKNWRRETISAVESYCDQPKVELWVYGTNIGITQHQIRIQKRALEIEEFGIWLEEDMEIDFDAYTAIDIENRVEASRPMLFSGFSEFNHEETTKQIIKSSLFVPVWGLTLNASLVELVESVWKQQRYNPSVVEKSIRRVFLRNSLKSRIHLRSIEKYWVKYMSWGFSNPNRWDALALYALWTQDLYVYSSVNRTVYDISYQDHRGMNQRIKSKNIAEHIFVQQQVDEFVFCKDCEIRGSRISTNLFDRVNSSLKYRFNTLNATQ
jgi:hypothetical protein